MFDDFDLIYSYTRAEAITDGVLIDVSEVAKKSDFTVNTAITVNLLAEIDAEEQLPVLFAVFHDKIKFGNSSEESVSLQTLSKNGRVITVILHIGSGDAGEPVLTLMLPEDM